MPKIPEYGGLKKLQIGFFEVPVMTEYDSDHAILARAKLSGFHV